MNACAERESPASRPSEARTNSSMREGGMRFVAGAFSLSTPASIRRQVFSVLSSTG